MQQVLKNASAHDTLVSVPSAGGKSLTTAERRSLDLSSQIPGWGSDLDPSVRPGVPRDKAPYLGVETLYPNFEQQIPRNKVHRSIEHAKLTPVFGNACPPRGLSGKIRDFAYGFSEGRMAHWLPLMAADRVDMIEEFLLDLARLKIPNIPSEMGIKSELRYNPKGVAKKAAIVGALGVLAYVAFARKKLR